jgi:NDP-sugar pyrophosphorylase family protein
VKGAILGAGLGKRLDPLTAQLLPKPIFPLGGKVPIAELWVRRFAEAGLSQVSMNLCVLADAIRHQFAGSGLSFVEEETPTGTLGGVCKMALGSAAKSLAVDTAPPAIQPFSGSTVIVPSGDIVSEFPAALLAEMYELHRKSGAAVSMALTEVPWDRRKDFGTVVLDAPEKRPGQLSSFGTITDFREKDPDSPSNLNNASIYMIEMDLLRALDPYRTEARVGLETPLYDFGKHVFPAVLGRIPYLRLSKDYRMVGLQFDGPWFDVGTKRDYLEVNRQVLNGVFDVRPPYEKTPFGYLGSNVSIDFGKVEIHAPVVIGNDCVIEPGAVLGPYAVIGDGWHVGAGAMVRDSVLWERYACYPTWTTRIPVSERIEIDPHQIRPGVLVDRSIVAGGLIGADTVEKTVDVRADGQQVELSIDYVPGGPRA